SRSSPHSNPPPHPARLRQPRRSSRPRFFFLTDAAPSDICTLSLHDALPICLSLQEHHRAAPGVQPRRRTQARAHRPCPARAIGRSEEHTSELQALTNLVCRLLLEKQNTTAMAPVPMVTPAEAATSSAGHVQD